jgi:hypothetical protein
MARLRKPWFVARRADGARRRPPSAARGPRRQSAAPGALFVWLTGLLGCANLPDIDSACGNAIVEPGEDCDSYAEGANTLCRAPGVAGECHLDCAPAANGARHACPEGWGCDYDDLCREPSGQFTALTRFDVGGADSLMVGDFDNDGRADVLSRKPTDLANRATLRFHYFDRRGSLEDTRQFPRLSVPPALGQLASDPSTDVAFSDFRLGVLLGRADRTWVPELYTPYVLRAVAARIVGLADGPVGDSSPIVTLTTLQEGPGLYVPDTSVGAVRSRGALTMPVERLLGDPAHGDVIEGAASPCEELILAYGGQSSFELFDMCSLDAQSGQAVWRPAALRSTVQVADGAAIDHAPLVADIDADGHLDVMIGAAGRPYVAYGDGLRVASTAVPYQPVAHDLAADVPELGATLPMPLAVGDISGDGVLDFVLPDRIVVSFRQPGVVAPRYMLTALNYGSPWTTARIADLNGNGLPDVVTGSRGSLNIDFYSGTGSRYVVTSQISTSRPVSQLSVGDFDGDLIGDVAFIETSARSGELDSLMISFGQLSRPPEAGSLVANVARVEQLGAYRAGGIDNLTVVASSGTGEQQKTFAYLLDGSSERIPFSPLETISFADNLSLLSAASVSIGLGSFVAPTRKDLLALTLGDEFVWRFWLVPFLEGSEPTPQLLAGSLDPRLLPSGVRPMQRIAAAKVFATNAVADLDRDGVDDSIWAMPADAGAHCGVETFRVAASGDALALASRGVAVFDVPCDDPQLLPVDADQDGFVDVALLTGADGSTERRLLVLWNDGAGGLSAERSTRIETPTGAPQAFTVLTPVTALEASENRPLTFAYVTIDALMLAPSLGARSFAPGGFHTRLQRGTAIVSGDFNGDKALDLAVADDGDLCLLNAELKHNER